MFHTICSVKDRAAEAFGRPMYVASTGVAVRGFTDEVNRADKDNQLYNHPDDFDLYDLGVFDDSTGMYTLRDNPTILVRGKDVKTK
jgi:hypothetical protein